MRDTRLVGSILMAAVLAASFSPTAAGGQGYGGGNERGGNQRGGTERPEAVVQVCALLAPQDGSTDWRWLGLRDLVARAGKLITKGTEQLSKAEEEEKNATSEEDKKKAQRKQNALKKAIAKARAALRSLTKNLEGDEEMTDQARKDLEQADRDINNPDEIAGARSRLKKYGLSDKQIDGAQDQIATHLKESGRSEPLARFVYGIAVSTLKSIGKDVCDGPVVTQGLLDVWKGET